MGPYLRLQSQHQQAMQALQEAQKMLESDTIKAAGEKEIAMIKAALQGKVEQIKLQGKMLEVKAGYQSDERLEVLRGKIQGMQQESEQRHERMLQTMDERHEIVLSLLKELGAKEQERHSVALHDAAAANAADRANLSATLADSRAEVSSERADVRAEDAATRAVDRAVQQDTQTET